MVITTTNEVQDKKVVEYKGIVFGEVISGVNMFKDLGANLRNIFGGRSKGYENELLAARTNAFGGNGEQSGGYGCKCCYWRKNGL